MKILTADKVRKELMYGIYDNIKNLEIVGGKLIPIIEDGSSVFMIGKNIEITIDLKHLFQFEHLGIDVDDIDLFDFNYITNWGFTDATPHLHMILNTNEVNCVKAVIKNTKRELIEYASFIEESLDGELDSMIFQMNCYCASEY